MSIQQTLLDIDVLHSFSGLRLQRSQALFEVTQGMTPPDAAHVAGGDEDPAFAQLVTHSNLAMCRLFNGIGGHGCLDLFVYTVLQSGLATGFVSIHPS
ncbi:hypothetical protein KDW95_22725 [Marinobacterium rhizophilum]|uniref:Uncharacterized protein n=1 Tax=Marinobacterium rhizophilum TaxID=420402 RepID=A0ABY5HIT1_9GAMM|nr:hypothetical protein KDW95_22725 [Marinobacterium rhizophilum]